MAGIFAAATTPLVLSRIESHQSHHSRTSRTSRYTDPWTEPLDDEISRLPSPAVSNAPTDPLSDVDQDESVDGGDEIGGNGQRERTRARRERRDSGQTVHSSHRPTPGRQRSFEAPFGLGLSLHRPPLTQSSKSLGPGEESGDPRRRRNSWGWPWGRENEGERERRLSHGGEVDIEMGIPRSPGSQSMPGLGLPSPGHPREGHVGRELERELGVEEDIPEDVESEQEAETSEDADVSRDESGRTELVQEESLPSEDQGVTTPKNEEQLEHIGALAHVADVAGQLAEEEEAVEEDIEHDEAVDAARAAAAAAAAEAEKAEARDTMSSPQLGQPTKRRRGWSLCGRSLSMPTFLPSEKSLSPEPDHRRQRLFKVREHRRNMKLSRTMSFASSFSMDSPRKKQGTSWLWKLWLAIFPPESQDTGFIPNYRYTPILSGIVVPFAILLEVPGLTEHWYIRTDNNITVDYQPNPTILDVGLGISMAAGVIANLALFARFLERRVLVSTIVATVALAVHDVINIAIVTIFGVIHRFNDGFTYGEAFWITVCSTIASTFVNITLIYDLVKTKDFARSGSGLTAKQRSLVVVVMLLICYIAVGALINAFANGLSFLDALYFTIVSIETIGFGDIVPITVFSKIFIGFYVTIGILNLALAVSTTRETIIEAFENAYRIRRAKIHQRRREHRQARKLRQQEEDRLRELGLLPRYVNVRTGRRGAATKVVPMLPDGTIVQSPISERPMSPDGFGHPLMSSTSNHFSHGNAPPAFPLTASTLVPPYTANDLHSAGLPSVAESSTIVASGPPTADGISKEDAFVTPQDEVKKIAAELRGDMFHLDLAAHSEEESYLEFKKRMEKEETREFYTKLAWALSLFFVFWLGGAAIFSKTEAWTFATGMYFCFITFTTLGYGDDSPSSPAGRAIFCVWALAGVGAMTILISVISEAYSSRYKTVVVRHGMLDRAVKHMHDKQAREEANLRNHSHDNAKTPSPRVSFDADTPLAVRYDSVSKAIDKSQKELEALPAELLRQAKTLHDHLNFLSKPPHGVAMPPTMQKLVDDVVQSEHLDVRMKRTLMEDEEARRTLFMMSYEKSLNDLIHSAEKAVELLAKREQKHQALDRLHRLTLERTMTTGFSVPDGAAPELYPPTGSRHVQPTEISAPMEPRLYDAASESMRQREGRQEVRRQRPKVRIDISGLRRLS